VKNSNRTLTFVRTRTEPNPIAVSVLSHGPYALATKSKARPTFDRHSGDKKHPLSTKSTELNLFNFANNVDHHELSYSTTVASVYRALDLFQKRIESRSQGVNEPPFFSVGVSITVFDSHFSMPTWIFTFQFVNVAAVLGAFWHAIQPSASFGG